MRSRRPSHSAPRARQHKLLQLCAAIRRSLEMTLAGEFDDPLLQDLTVEAVEPADDSRLRVLIGVHGAGLQAGRQEVAMRLEAAKGHLLQEVSQAIPHRRKVPELVFELVPAPAPGGA